MSSEQRTPKSKSLKQNLTVQLDKSVIRLARVRAAKEGLSISKLVARLIEEAANGSPAPERMTFEEAREFAKQMMRTGAELGGGPYSRDELHER